MKTVTQLTPITQDTFNSIFSQAEQSLENSNAKITELLTEIDLTKKYIKDNYTILNNLYNQAYSSFLNTLLLYNINSNTNTNKFTFDFKKHIQHQNSNIQINSNTVTLPVTEIIDIPLETANIKTISPSNGQYINPTKEKAIIDGSDITYAKYIQSSNVDKLILAFEVNLNKPQLFNYISLGINFLNTTYWPCLKSIQVSANGYDFVDLVQQQIELNPTILNGNLFELFTLPIYAQYIRIQLEQQYLNKNTKLFEIGINELKVKRYHYARSGSLYLKAPFDFSNIHNISAYIDIYQPNSSINILNFINLNSKLKINDNIETQITFINEPNPTKKIIPINSPWLNGNINVQQSSKHIELQIDIAKNITPSALHNILLTYYQENIETIPIQQLNSLPITLNAQPNIINSSLELLVGGFITVNSNGQSFKLGTIADPINKPIYQFTLPCKLYEEDAIAIGDIELKRYTSIEALEYTTGYYYNEQNNSITIKINTPRQYTDHKKHKEPWLYPAPENSVNSGLQAENALDIDEQIDEINPLYYKGKDILLKIKPSIYHGQQTFKLRFKVNGKNNVKIDKVFLTNNGTIEKTVTADVIPAGQRIINLTYTPIKDEQKVVAAGLLYEVDYIDGTNEFIKTNDDYVYSIDYNKKILYLKKPLDTDVSITYWHYKKYQLSNEHFEIDKDWQTITIADSVYSQEAYFIVEYQGLMSLLPDSFEYNNEQNSITINNLNFINEFNLPDNIIKKVYLIIKYTYTYNFATQNTDIIYNMFSPIIKTINIIYN